MKWQIIRSPFIFIKDNRRSSLQYVTLYVVPHRTGQNEFCVTPVSQLDHRLFAQSQIAPFSPLTIHFTHSDAC